MEFADCVTICLKKSTAVFFVFEEAVRFVCKVHTRKKCSGGEKKNKFKGGEKWHALGRMRAKLLKFSEKIGIP